MTQTVTKETRKPITQNSKSLLDSLEHLTGKLEFTATNDYMFRAVFQSNEKALKGLLSALLNIPVHEIISVTILNPIELGEAIDEKTIVMDLNILLNNNKILNLEMQVANQGDWPERSLFYLCKNYAKLESGKPYKTLLPVIHIGILDFSPFPDNKQFYSEYLLRETKTNHIYSDKLSIRMLNLKQIENVTDNERQSNLYQWAKLFKATTWEEIKMLAKDDSSISEFTFTLYEMSEDEKIRYQCFARERYEHDRASAIEYGIEQGIEQGIERGHNQINKLNHQLIEANRFDDLKRSTTDPKYQAELLKEFNL